VSFSGFIVVLSSLARKPQLRSLKVCSVQGSLPRATKMSTSFEGKVQSTVTVRVPADDVVNVSGTTTFEPTGKLSSWTTTVDAAGVGGGVEGTVGGVPLPPQPDSPASISTPDAASATAFRFFMARPSTLVAEWTDASGAFPTRPGRFDLGQAMPRSPRIAASRRAPEARRIQSGRRLATGSGRRGRLRPRPDNTEVARSMARPSARRTGRARP
jgi:hypothetical protein